MRHSWLDFGFKFIAMIPTQCVRKFTDFHIVCQLFLSGELKQHIAAATTTTTNCKKQPKCREKKTPLENNMTDSYQINFVHHLYLYIMDMGTSKWWMHVCTTIRQRVQFSIIEKSQTCKILQLQYRETIYNF